MPCNEARVLFDWTTSYRGRRGILTANFYIGCFWDGGELACDELSVREKNGYFLCQWLVCLLLRIWFCLPKEGCQNPCLVWWDHLHMFLVYGIWFLGVLVYLWIILSIRGENELPTLANEICLLRNSSHPIRAWVSQAGWSWGDALVEY